jgi:hypothetical protein
MSASTNLTWLRIEYPHAPSYFGEMNIATDGDWTYLYLVKTIQGQVLLQWTGETREFSISIKLEHLYRIKCNELIHEKIYQIADRFFRPTDTDNENHNPLNDHDYTTKNFFS